MHVTCLAEASKKINHSTNSEHWSSFLSKILAEKNCYDAYNQLWDLVSFEHRQDYRGKQGKAKPFITQKAIMK